MLLRQAAGEALEKQFINSHFWAKLLQANIYNKKITLTFRRMKWPSSICWVPATKV